MKRLLEHRIDKEVPLHRGRSIGETKVAKCHSGPSQHLIIIVDHDDDGAHDDDSANLYKTFVNLTKTWSTMDNIF